MYYKEKQYSIGSILGGNLFFSAYRLFGYFLFFAAQKVFLPGRPEGVFWE
jgi:hypothetical protein